MFLMMPLSDLQKSVSIELKNAVHLLTSEFGMSPLASGDTNCSNCLAIANKGIILVSTFISLMKFYNYVTVPVDPCIRVWPLIATRLLVLNF